MTRTAHVSSEKTPFEKANLGAAEQIPSSLVFGPPSSFFHEVYAANIKGVLYRSDNDGSTWSPLPAKNSPGDRPSRLAVDKNGQVYFGGSSKGLFRYSELDGMWVPLNQGLPNTSVRSLLFVKDSLFLGTSGANNYETFDGNDLFRSDNSGAAWTRMTSGLGHPRVKALEVNSKGIVFAGTWGGGVYRSTRPASRHH